MKSISVPEDQAGPPSFPMGNLPPVACCVFADSVRADAGQASVADTCLAIAARAGAAAADSISRAEAVDTRSWLLARR